MNHITWQRPTLPHSLPCSTIGAIELNFPVRNGKECFLYAIITRFIFLLPILWLNNYILYRLSKFVNIFLIIFLSFIFLLKASKQAITQAYFLLNLFYIIIIFKIFFYFTAKINLFINIIFRLLGFIFHIYFKIIQSFNFKYIMFCAFM